MQHYLNLTLTALICIYGANYLIGCEAAKKSLSWAGSVGVSMRSLQQQGCGVAQMALGDGFTCVILTGGTVKCWGHPCTWLDGNQTTPTIKYCDRSGDPGGVATPLTVPLPAAAKDISASAGAACAILDGGSVYCWGLNNYGQTGQPNSGTTNSTTQQPPRVVKLGSGRTAVGLCAGVLHHCAVLDDGSLKCWGACHEGQCGPGSQVRGRQASDMGDNLAPIDLTSNTSVTVTQCEAGYAWTCALLSTGDLKCFGRGLYGVQAVGDTIARGLNASDMGDALRAADLGGHVAQLPRHSQPADHMCAQLTSGQWKCWGRNNEAQLGTGAGGDLGGTPLTIDVGIPPLDVGGPVKQVVCGGFHNCAQLQDDTIRCWGRGYQGSLGWPTNGKQIGDQPGQMGSNLPVVQLGGPDNKVSQVALGAVHTCVVLAATGQLKCFGAINGVDSPYVGLYASQMGDNLAAIDVCPNTVPPPPPPAPPGVLPLPSSPPPPTPTIKPPPPSSPPLIAVCTGGSCSGGKKSNTGAIVGAAVGGSLALVVLAGFCLFFVLHKKKKEEKGENPPSVLPPKAVTDGWMGARYQAPPDHTQTTDDSSDFGHRSVANGAAPHVLVVKAGDDSVASQHGTGRSMAHAGAAAAYLSHAASATAGTGAMGAAAASAGGANNSTNNTTGSGGAHVVTIMAGSSNSNMAGDSAVQLKPPTVSNGPRRPKEAFALRNGHLYRWLEAAPEGSFPLEDNVVQVQDNAAAMTRMHGPNTPWPPPPPPPPPSPPPPSGGHQSPDTMPVVQLSSEQAAEQIELIEDGFVGEGATAVVYKCRWPARFGPHTLLAAKVLKDPFAATAASALASFEHEARVLEAVRHPNVVRMYGYCLERPRAVILLELLPGSLRDSMYDAARKSAAAAATAAVADSSRHPHNSGLYGYYPNSDQWARMPGKWPATVGDVLQVASGIARGLAHLHRKTDPAPLPDASDPSMKVVHRDLKPGNVLLNSLGQAKISDFGLARENNLRTTVDTVHLGAGTLRYMAPEILGSGLPPTSAQQQHQGGRRITAKVDIYSLATIMWEMVTKTVPWKGFTDVQVPLLVAGGQRPPFLSTAAANTFYETTITDRAWRYQTATTTGLVGIRENELAVAGAEGSTQQQTGPVRWDDAASFELLPCYVQLISRCWHGQPEQRPAAEQVLQELEQLIAALAPAEGLAR